jgi:hypothetical protein
MIINVPNRPPKFTDGLTTLPPISVAINSIFNYLIPNFEDPDKTIPMITFIQSTSPISATLTSTSVLNINPTAFSEVGLHEAFIQLADSITSVKFSLKITVTNTAPYFSTNFKDLIVPINK